MPEPEVIKTRAAIRRWCDRAREEGASVGFVPTMGSLHEGHLSLIRRAGADNDSLVVSIFVNPTQFGPGEDYNSYPRELASDTQKCREAGVNAIFAPPPDEMYSPAACTTVDQTVLTELLCGAFRQTHFKGVLTIVAKLFNVVGPCRAYFGQKDYQQFVLIDRMIRDLDFPVEAVMCPVVRESDGLAMSSRNKYLSPAERRDALCLSRALQTAKEKFAEGERRSSELIATMRGCIDQIDAAKIDYVAVVHPHTLQPIAVIEETAVAAIAVRMGSARLIDNVILGEE